MSPFPGSCVKVSLEEARAVIAATIPNRRIRTVILHHFWRPNARQWKGVKTIRGVRNYHVRKRRWRDIAYNWCFGPDGTITTGRSLMITGGHTIGRNKDSIGLGMCLNGDRELLADFPLMETSVLEVTAELCRVHGLDEHDLEWHSAFARKSCPGHLMDLEHYRGLLGQLVSPVGSELLWVRLVVDGKHIEGAPLVNRAGHTTFAEDWIGTLDGEEDLRVPKDQRLREFLEARGYVINSWRPTEGPAGSVYAYRA